jgi:dihydrofolate reductase
MDVRKVVSGLFMSLDGVTESPNLWQFDHFDEGLAAFMSGMLDAQDAILLGRVTYQEWAGYWPTSTDEPFASYINGIPKYVVSRTLDNVDAWQNSTLVKGDLAEEIGKLKQQPGKNIGVAGSVSLVRSLLEAGLLDELQLAVHPVLVGKGARLFEDGSDVQRLSLVSSTISPTGVALVTYQPRTG